MIGVLGGAKEREAGVAVGVECRKRAINHDEGHTPQALRQLNEDLLRDLDFGAAENPAARAQPVGRYHYIVVFDAHFRQECGLLKFHVHLADSPHNQFAKDFRVVDELIDAVTRLDEIEVHPLRPAGTQPQAMPLHDRLELRWSGQRKSFGNRIEVQGVADNRRRKGLHELRLGLVRLKNGLRAPGIVITGMYAVLVDSRRGPQNTKRVEEMDLVPGLGEANRDRCAVNAGAGHGNSGLHDSRPETATASAGRLAGTSIPWRTV